MAELDNLPDEMFINRLDVYLLPRIRIADQGTVKEYMTAI
jgi:hypothetical protein